MGMRPAIARRGSHYFAASDIALIRLLLQLHDQAGCDDPDCPADRLGAFLAQLENELHSAGRPARAQIWASLFILPSAEHGPRLEQRIPPSESFPAPRKLRQN